MKNIDKETVLKIIVDLCISGFLYFLICSNKVGEFVHPRIIIFIKLSIVLFIIIAFVLLFETQNKSYVKRKLNGYYVYIIPFLILCIFINFAPTSAYISSDINNIREKIASDNEEVLSNKKKIQRLIENDIFEVGEENYIDFLNLASKDYEAISKKTITMTGFVYRDNSLNKDEFALVRILMSCCSADTKVVGMICNKELDKSYKNDTWVKVSGRLQKNNKGEAILKINSIKVIDKPSNIYIYYH